ncbi:TIGR01548 family HAD-type hydrolase [Allocoleopsis franciscana]|uniref:Haloacid dehalogenase superfamily protein, subfamily IA hydrolase, TIGR01548 n=1 Tax=Allocoleopsis franciscana PCC 7113 TaxID=1173027 RepID=K9WFI9_9CYAN|nr:TIGR01548 family HAD-type hydrolase [Allocoleopsis franciscana]AFZ18534.1 haloacid dehalogenase superfamily protein, subfamily IA hydrolase, TIGR01548 [Allocoleopsis franciscana PCC 7113]
MTHPQSQTFTSQSTAIVIFDIDGVVRDVAGSYRRAIADTVEHFTNGVHRPSGVEIDQLKSEGFWNNDWEASQEIVYRYFERQGQTRMQVDLNYDALIAFFQSRYQGTDPEHWTGYICTEPLLIQSSSLERLTAAGISWGFFSGAPRREALYALTTRLGLVNPVLIAMEDAPGKPDPTGLLATIEQLGQRHNLELNTPVLYAGDTVADMYTIQKAKTLYPKRTWIGVGILPPHVQAIPERCEAYQQTLQSAGAAVVLSHVEQLTPERIQQLVLQG